MRIFLILALFIAGLAMGFALQNSWIVTISFAVWQVQASLALILIVTLAIGILIGLLVSMPILLKRGWQSTGRKRAIAALDDDLRQKNQLIADQKRRIDYLESNLQESGGQISTPENF